MKKINERKKTIAKYEVVNESKMNFPYHTVHKPAQETKKTYLTEELFATICFLVSN